MIEIDRDLKTSVMSKIGTENIKSYQFHYTSELRSAMTGGLPTAGKFDFAQLTMRSMQ